jgi:hypothetical protein
VGTEHDSVYAIDADSGRVYMFALNSSKTVKSLKLPANREVVLLAGELLP